MAFRQEASVMFVSVRRAFRLARVLLRRSLFLISGGWLLIGGCWLFICSSWLLIGSCRLLIGGCWLLMSSFWLLISSGRLLVCRLFYRFAVGICLCLLSVYFCIDLFLDRINLAFQETDVLQQVMLLIVIQRLMSMVSGRLLISILVSIWLVHWLWFVIMMLAVIVMAIAVRLKAV